MRKGDKVIFNFLFASSDIRPQHFSHTYYVHEGKVGIHTRLSGLLREKNKELIIKHLGKNKGYLHDLQLAFQELKPQDISNLLQELKRERKIRFVGSSKTGYWEIAN